MTGLVDVFGGSTVQPSNVAYASVALSATIPTYWPAYVVGTQQPLARLMDVIASITGLSIQLPDATLAGLGQDVFFNNPGSNTFTVQDSSGNPVATIAPGQQKYLYLSDNSTPAGVWRVTLFGVGTSALDASTLAGSGLKAIGSSLNQSAITASISSSQTLTLADRAKLFVNIGGAITVTLPLTSSVGNDFFFEIRNQGTGVVTISPTDENIDASASITLQLNESCFVQSGTGAWYTVGRGRNTQFSFTQLLKSVTGGTTTLSLTEASNVVQTYSGTATSNNTIVVPSVVQVYYIANNVLGGYGFTIQSPTPGATLGIPYGQAAVVFCDGVNVVNASTSVGGITALLLAGGSAGAPSLAIGASNNGLFAPSSATIAVSASGVETTRFTQTQVIQNVPVIFGTGITFPANMTATQLRTAAAAAAAGPLSTSGITGAAAAGPLASSGITGAAASGSNSDITSLLAVTSINGGSIYGRRNINGEMEIDQVNSGSAVTPTASAPLTDMFGCGITQPSKLTFQQVSDAPPGLKNSMKITVASQYSPLSSDQLYLRTAIEGKDIIDFQLGAAGAATFTVSQWIKGSVPGTYAISLWNQSLNRSYVGTVSVTTSWAQLKITITGDLTGAWATDNSIGMYISWDLGSGSTFNASAGIWNSGFFLRTTGSVSLVSQIAGSTLNITGVDVRLGSVSPTVFERRINELQLCQRYYEICDGYFQTYSASTTVARGSVPFKVTKRIAPVIDKQVTGVSLVNNQSGNPLVTGYSLTAVGAPTVNSASIDFTTGGTFSIGQGSLTYVAAQALSFSARLF